MARTTSSNRFMVIYPHPLKRTLLSLTLEHYGNKVTAVESALQAHKYTKYLHRFDAIFMDVSQHRMVSMALTTWVRKNAPNSILIGISDSDQINSSSIASQNIFFCIQTPSLDLERVKEALQVLTFAIVGREASA